MRAAVSEAAYSEVCLSRYTVTARRRRVFVHPCSGSACSTVVVLQTLGLDIPTHTHREDMCLLGVCVQQYPKKYSEICLSRYIVTARRRRVFVNPCSGSVCSTVVVLQTLCLDIPSHTHLGDMSSHSRLQNFFSSRAFINVVILLRCSNAPFEKSGSSFNWKHPKRHLEVEELEVFAARLNEFQILKALAANRGCGSRRACRQLRRYHERTKDWTCFLPGARSRKCFQTTVQGSKFGSALHE